MSSSGPRIETGVPRVSIRPWAYSTGDSNRQKSDGQWARVKGFDTFCPLGPVIETESVVGNQAIETRVNGEVRQSGRLDEMVHSVASAIACASAVFTLLPGDVILMGTPAGAGPIVAGDAVDVTVEGVGSLSNPMR